LSEKKYVPLRDARRKRSLRGRGGKPLLFSKSDEKSGALSRGEVYRRTRSPGEKVLLPSRKSAKGKTECIQHTLKTKHARKKRPDRRRRELPANRRKAQGRKRRIRVSKSPKKNRRADASRMEAKKGFLVERRTGGCYIGSYGQTSSSSKRYGNGGKGVAEVFHFGGRSF